MIHVYTSLAAYFEKGEYDKAIEACKKAVEEGRSVCACSNNFYES